VASIRAMAKVDLLFGPGWLGRFDTAYDVVAELAPPVLIRDEIIGTCRDIAAETLQICQMELLKASA
jgi:hypothetical protein